MDRGDEALGRGQGVGAWVELRTLDHVFQDLGLSRLWCEVFVDNEAVWKLHLSFGFEVTERLEDHVVKAGVPRTAVRLTGPPPRTASTMLVTSTHARQSRNGTGT